MLRAEQKIRNLILFTIFSLFLVGVGYALIASDVTINGNLVVDKTTWDVHLSNVQLNEKNTVGQVPTLSENDTVLSYAASIEKPGDFYGFSFDVVNTGTIDAMLSSITVEGLPASLEDKINFSMKYKDGTTPTANDLLEAGAMERIVVEYEYPYDIDIEDLIGVTGTNNLSLTISYVQATGTTTARDHSFYKTLSYNAIPDNVSSEFVTTSTGVDFKNISSDTNGKGLYLLSSTAEDTYPVYYYRGNVTDNNAKFAGFCWKIVRTTENGGLKLIYNGLPDGNGKCTITSGTSTNAIQSAINSSSTLYTGYMYGANYQRQYEDVVDKNYLYGESFTYENGVYTLTNTTSLYDNTHHYTCFSDESSCSDLSYIYFVEESWYSSTGLIAHRNAYYITLSDGDDVDDAINEMNENTSNSTAKIAIDNWFNNTFKTYFTNNNKNYNDYLEDSIWCNDRQIADYGGWGPDGSITSSLRFAAENRLQAGTPTLACNKNDSFTVTESATGNGSLTYPVGLLTVDEINLAGGGQLAWNSNTSSWYINDYYLSSNVSSEWISMTPLYYERSYLTYYGIGTSVGHAIYPVSGSYSRSIRPSISIKKTVKVATGGDGTENNPYEFIVG